MAKRFLTHIDLQGNQLLKAALETRSADPVDNLVEGRIYYNTTDDAIKVYDGDGFVGIGEITSILGTSGEIDVNIVNGVATISLPTNISANASTADKLSTSRTISLSGDVTGSASFDGSSDATITATIAANSVALGTDTTGNYVASVGGTDGVSVSGSGENASVTIANTDKGSSQSIFKNVAVTGQDTIVADNNDDTLTIAGGTGISVTTNATLDTLTVSNSGVTSISGTTNEITVDASTGSVQIGLPDNVTVTSDLTVGGDLTVNGTTTTLNTTELLVEDNIITLNSNVTGTPSLNAGIEVERGTSANVSLRWNESTDTWELTRDGTTYEEITTVGTVTASDISDFTEATQDVIGGILPTTGIVPFTYDDEAGTISADITLAGTSYLSKTGNALAVDVSSVETKLVTDGFAKKMAANVGNGSATTFVISHNLGTEDVMVQVWSNDSTRRDQVEADVQIGEFSSGSMINTTNKITVSFATAPTSNAYRVVVIG